MSIVPHFKPEVIGQMPDEMFNDIQTALPTETHWLSRGRAIRWSETDKLHFPEDTKLIDILDPCIRSILKAEHQRVSFIEFSVRVGLILPGHVQTPASDRWHRDGFIRERPSRYITSDGFPTEFLGRWMSTYQPEPCELVRFNRKKHRSPTNNTDAPIHRTWVRATVHRTD